MTKTKQPMITAAYITERAKPRPWSMTEGQKAERLHALLLQFEPALVAAFDEVNGRAVSFTLTAGAAIRLARETEARLAAMGVPKADRPGTLVTMTSGGPSANSYKHAAIGTSFTLRRNSKGDWLLDSVRRVDVWPKQPERISLVVSEAARAAIVRRAMEGITTHANDDGQAVAA